MRVFVTGASSGIGAALARRWARPGVHLGVVGRRPEPLESLAEDLRRSGADVMVLPADVGDTEAMIDATSRFRSWAGGVDRVVANAGIGLPNRIRTGQVREVADLMRTNVLGVTNTVLPFVPDVVAQGSGALVAVGSVAGFRAMPGRAAYSASKAAVQTFMDGLRLELRGTGAHAMTVCPGFVRTAMTARLGDRLPFLLDVDDAAARIDRAIESRRRTYTFPLPMWLASAVWTRIPEAWLPRLLPARTERGDG